MYIIHPELRNLPSGPGYLAPPQVAQDANHRLNLGLTGHLRCTVQTSRTDCLLTEGHLVSSYKYVLGVTCVRFVQRSQYSSTILRCRRNPWRTMRLPTSSVAAV